MFSKFSEDNGRAFQAEPFSGIEPVTPGKESRVIGSFCSIQQPQGTDSVPMLIQGPNYFDPGEHGMNFEYQKDIKCHLKMETFAGLVKI